MGNSASVENGKLVTSFEEVRKTLLEERFADRLEKPLGYWVLPNDRRLPLAFLNHKLEDLLATPFNELTATPGIGQKKIGSLIKLLHRATNDEPPAVPFGISELVPDSVADNLTPVGVKFDPSVVSEALWSQWREAVRKFDIGHEKLGRLAPSLQNLPTVIWHTPLSQYLDHTVGEIRGLRTHGEKRVRCVLEVFHSVYHKLSKAEPGEDLHRLLTPTTILHVHDWVGDQLQGNSLPVDNQISECFSSQLLKQIQIDSGPTVYRLATERLGIGSEPLSVRAQARSLGVTRARIYQLLDDCGKVMNVRWPEGKNMLDQATARFSGLGHDSGELRLFYGIKELCFPEKQKEILQSTIPVAESSHPPLDRPQTTPFQEVTS